MVRCDWLYGTTAFRGLGEGVLEASKRPDVHPLRVWKPLSNLWRVREQDNVPAVFGGFLLAFVRDGVDVLVPPRFFTLAEAKRSIVGNVRAVLLELATAPYELAAPVVVVGSLSECAGIVDRCNSRPLASEDDTAASWPDDTTSCHRLDSTPDCPPSDTEQSRHAICRQSYHPGCVCKQISEWNRFVW